MLQLLATQIIEICFIDGTDRYKFKFEILLDESGESSLEPCYKNDDYWIGIPLLGEAIKQNIGNKRK